MAKQHVLRTSTKTGKAIRVERLKARSKPGHVPSQYWVVNTNLVRNPLFSIEHSVGKRLSFAVSWAMRETLWDEIISIESQVRDQVEFPVIRVTESQMKPSSMMFETHEAWV